MLLEVGGFNKGNEMYLLFGLQMRLGGVLAIHP